jgi:hypothetical protein
MASPETDVAEVHICSKRLRTREKGAFVVVKDDLVI